MQNYYSVFNLPLSFEIDLSALEKSYFNAQRRFHPDRLLGKPPAGRNDAIRQSMLINEAYEALKTPLMRARHLLALQGQKEEKAPQALLIEMMESREALAEAGAEALSTLDEQNKKNIEQALKHLSQAFAKADWRLASELVIRLSYLEKLAEEIRIRKKNIT